MAGAQFTRLGDGRVHFHHGPIDIIAQAFGEPGVIAQAELAAYRRFSTVLAELVPELPQLRRPDTMPTGAIAKVMTKAIAPYRPAFITPMAAVAGAVAEAVLAPFQRPGIEKAYVNNGGDIALYLTPGTEFRCTLAVQGHAAMQDEGDLAYFNLGAGLVRIRAEDRVRGIATSGWRGRSFSLGIADAVTVLAQTAAQADAAATMIANAVDLPNHPNISRVAADSISADSDLGQRQVTTGVGPLSAADCATALDRGAAAANAFHAIGLIETAALFLQAEPRVIGNIALREVELA